MAFYNPYQYPPYSAMPQQTGMQGFPQPGGQIVRVNGFPGAQAFQMRPNESAALFDANEDYFYIKTTDGAGFATLRRYRFSPDEPTSEIEKRPDYVTRAEFDELKGVVLNGKQHLRAQQSDTEPAE